MLLYFGMWDRVGWKLFLETSQSSAEGRLRVRIYLPDNTANVPQKKDSS